MSIFAYLLACNYTVCLSYFIIRHLRRPLRSGGAQKLWSLHAVCHGTAASAALAVLASDSVGTSIMTTCFIQSGTKAEYSLHRVLLIVPLSLYAPLCLYAALYSLRKYRTHFLLRRYIVKHTFVVITFSLCWFFPALIHFLNEPDIDQAKKQRVLGDVAMISGAISGLLTVTVRLMEPGLVRRLLNRKGNRSDLAGIYSPQVSRTSDIEIIARKRAGSFPSLYSAQAMVQNAQQFAQSLLIALHFCFAQYQDLSTQSTVKLLDLEVLRRHSDLYQFTKEHSKSYPVPDFQCEVEENSAEIVQRIRGKEGVTASQLGRALSPGENWTRTTEVTGGRSGSFFFKTADGSVILKTVTHEEVIVLQEKVLPNWPRNSSTSLICPIYGLFSIRLPGTLREHVLLMYNLTQIPRPIYATFDLKGSRFNRKVLRRPTAETPLVQSDTLKDTDFQLMIGKLSLSEEDVNRLTSAIFSDISLLHSLQLMDYSLLISIGECSQTLLSLPPRYQKHLFRCTNAPNRVYAIGIIDFLQGYSFSKRLERMGKRLIASTMDISSVSPDVYGDRFLDMVREITE